MMKTLIVDTVSTIQKTETINGGRVPTFQNFREVLENVSRKKRGTFFSVVYFRADIRPYFRSTGILPVTIRVTCLQKCKQEAKASIVEAGGVKFNPACQYEQAVDEENGIYRHIKNGKLSLRFPTAGKRVRNKTLVRGQIDLSTGDFKVLSKEEFETMMAHYAPKAPSTTVQDFRKFVLAEDIAASFEAAISNKKETSFGFVWAIH